MRITSVREIPQGAMNRNGGVIADVSHIGSSVSPTETTPDRLQPLPARRQCDRRFVGRTRPPAIRAVAEAPLTSARIVGYSEDALSNLDRKSTRLNSSHL